jgi:hypothetical protein
MAKNRIEIVITAAAQGLQSGLRRAMGIVGDFVNDIKGIGAAGMAAFSALNQAVFFFTQNIQTAIQIAKGLYNIFLDQAVQAERYGVVLEHLTGSEESAIAVMERIDQISQELGQDWEQVAAGGQQLAAAAKDAEGNFDIDLWEELLQMTEDLSATRPDVPFQLMARGVTAALQGDLSQLTRLLDVNVSKLMDLEDAAEGAINQARISTGTLTGLVEIEVEKTAQGGIEAMRTFLENYGAAGAAQAIAEETIVGSWGRIKAEFESATRDIGEKFLPLITEGLQTILEWWDEHEDDVMAIADTFAEGLVDKLQNIDWKAVAGGITSVVKAVTDLFTAIDELANSPAAQWFERTFNPETGSIGSIQTYGERQQEQGQAFRENVVNSDISEAMFDALNRWGQGLNIAVEGSKFEEMALHLFSDIIGYGD